MAVTFTLSNHSARKSGARLQLLERSPIFLNSLKYFNALYNYSYSIPDLLLSILCEHVFSGPFFSLRLLKKGGGDGLRFWNIQSRLIFMLVSVIVKVRYFRFWTWVLWFLWTLSCLWRFQSSRPSESWIPNPQLVCSIWDKSGDLHHCLNFQATSTIFICVKVISKHRLN